MENTQFVALTSSLSILVLWGYCWRHWQQVNQKPATWLLFTCRISINISLSLASTSVPPVRDVAILEPREHLEQALLTIQQ